MKYLLLVPALLAAGCCTTDGRVPVFVETTLARLELPERPTRVVRLSAGGSESTWYVLTPDHQTTPPSVAGAQASGEDPVRSDCGDDIDKGMLGRVDVCLGKRLAFGYSRRHGGPRMGHVTLYLAGRDRERAKPGNVSLALSGAWGHDALDKVTRQSDGDEYRTHLQRHEKQVGLTLGYRTAKWLMVYGGPYRLDTEFDVEHHRPGALPQNESGNIVATGAHLGFALFAGRHSNWLIEYSRARVDAGQDERSIGNWSAKYQLEFWGAAPKPPKRK